MPVPTALVKKKKIAGRHLCQPGLLEIHSEPNWYKIRDSSGIATSVQWEMLI